MDRPHNRKFLGFSFTKTKRKRITISPQSLKRLRDKIREMTKPRSHIPLEERIKQLSRYLTGWSGYYALAENPAALKDIDGWMRRRLRMVMWRRWRLPRTKIRKLMQLGLTKRESFILVAMSRNQGPWAISHSRLLGLAMSPRYFRKLGVPSLIELYNNIRQGW